MDRFSVCIGIRHVPRLRRRGAKNFFENPKAEEDTCAYETSSNAPACTKDRIGTFFSQSRTLVSRSLSWYERFLNIVQRLEAPDPVC